LLIVFLPLLAAAFVVVAIATGLWVALWPAVVLVATTVVYALRLPGAFLKRSDGTLPWFSWLVWGPLFAYQWVVLEGGRRLMGEAISTEVGPGVYVARRPRLADLPPNIAIVVDLCAEFPAAPGIADGRVYLTLPTLDATAPTPEQIVTAVDAVIAANGPAFIHCAHGHGRSATVAAAVLIRRGQATLDDVEAKMKALRPRIGLNAGQRAALAKAIELGSRS
jgi:protein-tyrosine phosphatase